MGSNKPASRTDHGATSKLRTQKAVAFCLVIAAVNLSLPSLDSFSAERNARPQQGGAEQQGAGGQLDSAIVLENELLKAVFSRENGALIQLVAKPTNWHIHRRAELGRNFRMLVPVPGRRNNPVLGERQQPPQITHDPKSSAVKFTWDKLLSEHAGELDIKFVGSVVLTESGLSFAAEVTNGSGHVVETVSWPYLGELSRPDGAQSLEALHLSYFAMTKNPLYPVFKSAFGYWGTDYPKQFIHTPSTPLVLIDSDQQQGLYMGYHDTSLDRLVTFTLGLKPGYERTDFLSSGAVPTTEEISGQPVHLELSAVHFTYVAGGETTLLKPIVVRPYTGTWHAGVDFYKQWRKTWYEAPPLPAWARQVHSWQQIHINSPEDELRVRYRDLVQYGQDCAEHGVAAIQLTGWTVGGQDRGNPSHDVEPRLGTQEDLKWAIAEIQKLGVKMIMFNKFTWADRSTDWFRRELVSHAVKDPYGDYYVHPGYRYQTAAQHALINNRRLVPLCPVSAAWRELAAREFEKSIALGADGVLYDENQHHGGARYCFDAAHGHRQPAHTYSGDIPLAKMFRRIVHDKQSDFLFAGEGSFDLQLNEYGLCYVRLGQDHIPLHRYISPDTEVMIGVFGLNDRHLINQALMYRYILSYEPRNYKGRLQEFPLTLAYGKRVDTLRRRYADLLWRGEFRHTIGAQVLAEGEPVDHFAVFVDRKSGRRAVVVVNPSAEDDLEIAVQLPRAAAMFSVSPEDPTPSDTDGRATLPPLSAIVFMETE